MKKIMYLRSGPYEPDISKYNMQEVGMLTEFCKQGYDCDLFYYGKSKNTQVMNFGEEVGQLTIRFIKGIRLLRSGIYPKLLNRDFLKQYDMIIVSEYSQIMTVLISRMHPNVYCYNGPYYNLFKLPFMESVYDFLFLNTLRKNVKKFYCKSHLSEKYLNNKGLLDTVTVGVGQNFTKFMEIKEPSDTTKKVIEYMGKHKVLLVVGNIDERKNFPFILEIFSILVKSSSEFRLMFIGTGEEKYIERKLNKFDSKMKEKIFFVGEMSNTELQFIYPNAYVFLMPSKLEIFGMVLLEAMSFGSIAISSFNGGSSLLIEDNLNGYIRQIDDPSVWSNLILSNEFKFDREKIAYNAIKTVNESFTWENIVKKMLDNNDVK